MESDKTISNGTMEDVKKGFEQRRKEEKCPVCGGIRKRLDFMGHVEDSLARFIRENDLAKRESCLFCVKKHVGKALVLFRELEDSDVSHEGKGKIHTLLNHLEIIGNLQAASDEAIEYKDLWQFLLASERAYRYEGLAPDWEKIALLIHKNEGETI